MANNEPSQDCLSREEKDGTVDNLLVSNGECHQPGVGLRRKVGLVSGISLIVGTMIGSGIFASPRYVMENCGSVGLTLVVWCLCGVLAMFGALCYSELGTAISRSGGEYAYLYDAFGPLTAFLYSWTAVVVLKPSQVAIICLAFGAYVIEPFFPGCGDREDLQPLVKLLAAIAIGERLRYFYSKGQKVRPFNCLLHDPICRVPFVYFVQVDIGRGVLTVFSQNKGDFAFPITHQIAHSRETPGEKRLLNTFSYRESWSHQGILTWEILELMFGFERVIEL